MAEEREVNLSRIPREKRAEAWQRLQRKYPAQAAAVQSELVQLIHKRFNADIIVFLPTEQSNP